MQHGEFLRAVGGIGRPGRGAATCEHVVNILDGVGMFYGTRTGTGRSRTLGMALGCESTWRTKAHLLAELDGAELSAEERTSLLQALALAEDGEGLVSAARSRR